MDAIIFLICVMFLLMLMQPPESLYHPKNNLVACNDPFCSAFHLPENIRCEANDQCDYEVLYADHGSSLGVLVTDHFPLSLTNGSLLGPRLIFGWVILFNFLFINIPSRTWYATYWFVLFVVKVSLFVDKLMLNCGLHLVMKPKLQIWST